MVIDFALPIEHDLQRGFKNYLTKTKSAVADYGLHMAVTRFDTKVLFLFISVLTKPPKNRVSLF